MIYLFQALGYALLGWAEDNKLGHAKPVDHNL